MPRDQVFCLCETELSPLNLARFGVAELATRCDVVVVDFLPWLRPHVAASLPPELAGADYVAVQNQHEFSLMRRNISNSVGIFDFLGNQRKVNELRNTIATLKVPTIKHQLGLLPTPLNTSRLESYRVQMRNLPNVRRLPEVLTEVWPTGRGSRVAPDLMLVGGNEGFKAWDAKHAIETLPSHSFDYDNYLAAKTSLSRPILYPYAVFLDEGLSGHYDYVYHRLKAPIAPRTYFNHLERLFASFEEATGVQVVVAKHPSSPLAPYYLHHRKVFEGQTASLVRDACHVLAHVSTSISLGVLFEKPITFLLIPELANKTLGTQVRFRAELLHRPVVSNAREIASENLNRSVSKEHYLAYRRAFICCENSPDISSAEQKISWLEGTTKPLPDSHTRITR